MREQNIKAHIQIALSKNHRIRLFNQPSGQAWLGEVVNKDQEFITLRDYRPVKFGLAPGSSDLIGWHSEIITGEHVGTTIARFVAIETKSARGRTTEQQQNFIKAVTAAGGAAGIARSIAEAYGIIGGLNEQR